MRDNQFDKELANNHTLGTVLKQAAYATAAIGKWGLQGGSGFPSHPQNRGFDYFFGYMAHLDAHYHYPKEQGRAFYENFTNIGPTLDKCYSTDLSAARAKKWIADHRTANPAQPFFMYLCFAAPHAQLNVPTTAYPAGGGLTGGVQWTGTTGAVINTATGTIDSWIHPDYASATWDHDNNSGTADMFTTVSLAGAIASGEGQGFTPAMITEVCDAYGKLIASRGERTSPLEIASLAALSWHAGRKDQARENAEKALEMTRSKPDPKKPPAAAFERFAEAIRLDQLPPLRELQAARKAAHQAPGGAPQEHPTMKQGS